MRHKRGQRIFVILHNLMARGVWPLLFGLSLLFLVLGLNKPDVTFNTLTSMLYIGFMIALISTIYYVYKD